MDDLTIRAESGDFAAMMELAGRLESGVKSYDISFPHYDEIVKWYERAIEIRPHNQEAKDGLKSIAKTAHETFYHDGLCNKNDDSAKKAIKFGTICGNLGDLEALFNVGWFYAQGIGVSKDYKKAFPFFYDAALKGEEKSIGWMETVMPEVYGDGWGIMYESFMKTLIGKGYSKAQEELDTYYTYIKPQLEKSASSSNEQTASSPSTGQTSYPSNQNKKSGGCYIATAVYGAYDCPQVWTLRRYRDNRLATTVFGRILIRLYYSVSPKLVKLFGDSHWFKNVCKKRLDRFVFALQQDGYESAPYTDAM